MRMLGIGVSALGPWPSKSPQIVLDAIEELLAKVAKRQGQEKKAQNTGSPRRQQQP